MKPIDGPFTHIIVGAGSAGCLLANRLSARPENNVLLVEAGGWDQDFWQNCQWDISIDQQPIGITSFCHHALGYRRPLDRLAPARWLEAQAASTG